MPSRSPNDPAKTLDEPPRRGRPPKKDRSDVTSTTLTLRLTPAEREGLGELVAKRQEAARALGAVISPASLMRALLQEALKKEASLATKDKPPARSRSKKTTRTAGRKTKAP